MAMRTPTLAGRHCLVTGGGSGIGRGIALELARAGAVVAVGGRREDPLRETVALVEQLGGRALAVRMDVADARSVLDATEALAAQLDGRVDVLVNNAGVGGPNACSQDGPDRWHEIMRPNVDGVFYVTRDTLRFMPDGGRVINISSVLGKFGVPGYTAYCASKHAVIGFTKALALELAPRRITVNALCPGWVETDMARQGMQLLADGLGLPFDEARRHALAAVPLGRILQPEEIGATVVHLAGEAASGITAQAWSICGGQVMDG
jgi:ketoreductase